MKTKIVKLRSRVTGVARYEEVINTAGVIAVARATPRDRPDNERCAALVAWADGLGHPPTSAEFMAWYEARGGTFVDVTDESECAN